MNSSECWIGMHENCWDREFCACVCHGTWASWEDADIRTFEKERTWRH